MDPSDGELKSSPGATGLWLSLHFSSLSASRHDARLIQSVPKTAKTFNIYRPQPTLQCSAWLALSQWAMRFDLRACPLKPVPSILGQAFRGAGTSPGPDGVTAPLLKVLPDNYYLHLENIFTSIVVAHYWPTSSKTSNTKFINTYINVTICYTSNLHLAD